ncbi:MAG: two-component system response regulator [Sandaracinus sp.]|nr:two-component system response regulator [Sandaracinus sp.]
MADPMPEILVCDDDEDDLMLLQDAFEETELFPRPKLRCFQSGNALLTHLQGEDASRVAVILLDLNMPGLDGREVLRALRARPDVTPVVIFTTSQSPDDVSGAYQDGANSFIRKPASFESLVDVLRSLGAYWSDIVTVPAKVGRS